MPKKQALLQEILTRIKVEDLPDNIRDIAEAIGIEATIKLVKLCGGQSAYIPKMESCILKVKGRMIYEEFKANRSRTVYSDLARKYDYSEPHLRTIVAAEARA